MSELYESTLMVRLLNKIDVERQLTFTIGATWFEGFTWSHEAIAQHNICFGLGVSEEMTIKKIMLWIETFMAKGIELEEIAHLHKVQTIWETEVWDGRS